MAEPNYSVVFSAKLVGATTVARGDVLIPSASTAGRFVVATTANRGTRGSVGIALTAYGGSGVGPIDIQQSGTIDASLSGLSAGAKQLVRVSAAGRIERIASYSSGDDVIGYAEADGSVHLHFGLPWGEIAALAGGGGATLGGSVGDVMIKATASTTSGVSPGTAGKLLQSNGTDWTSATVIGGADKDLLYRSSASALTAVDAWTREASGRLNVTTSGFITYGAVGDTFSSTGILRAGSSIGSGATDLVSWYLSSAAASRSLISVQDATGGVGQFFIGNQSSNFYTFIRGGVQVRIDGGSQIALDSGSAAGAWGSGGILLNGNVGLNCSASLPSPTNFKGGSGVVFIGNRTSAPSSNPENGLLLSVVHAALTEWRFKEGDYFKFGGVQDVTTSGRNLTYSIKDATNQNTYAARSEYRGYGGRTRSATFWNEETTTTTSARSAFRFIMSDETFVAFSYQVVMVRGTNATKAGRYSGKTQYRRTGGAGPVIVGAASSDTDQETTAGDSVAVAVSGNEIQINITAADTDTRLWSVEVHVHEVAAT